MFEMVLNEGSSSGRFLSDDFHLSYSHPSPIRRQSVSNVRGYSISECKSDSPVVQYLSGSYLGARHTPEGLRFQIIFH